MLARCRRSRSPLSTGLSTLPVSPERNPYSSLDWSSAIPDLPECNDFVTVSTSLPRHDHIPIPVITTLLPIFNLQCNLNYCSVVRFGKCSKTQKHNLLDILRVRTHIVCKISENFATTRQNPQKPGAWSWALLPIGEALFTGYMCRVCFLPLCMAQFQFV